MIACYTLFKVNILKSELISFIESLEPSESWGFKAIDPELLKISLNIASQIKGNIHSVPKVGTDTWILFIALLPYTNSLDVLSDICEIIPNFIQKIINSKNTDISVSSARQLCLDRLNILVRQPLHKSVFDQKNIRILNNAIKAFHGNN